MDSTVLSIKCPHCQTKNSSVGMVHGYTYNCCYCHKPFRSPINGPKKDEVPRTFPCPHCHGLINPTGVVKGKSYECGHCLKEFVATIGEEDFAPAQV